MPAPRPGPNRRAVNATLSDLRAAGRLTPQHSALVQLVQSLAGAVDAEPDNASLWREYRGALGDLGRLFADEGDGLVELLGRLRAPLGDAAN